MGPIRFIFPAFVLAMWVAWGYAAATGALADIHWVMLALGYVGCAIIFVNFVYVFFYGYAISMVLANAAVMGATPTPPVLLVGGIGVAYGLRLGWFAWTRSRSAGYGGHRARAERANADVPLPLRLFMWICCSWLMAFVAMPAWVVSIDPELSVGVIGGLVLAIVGLVVEALADQQKQAAKAANPAGFVTAGLYARIRHPNYLGEILFQVGLVAISVAAAPSALALAFGTLGPLYIVILMVYAARDQDTQQLGRYGNDPAYREYRGRSGSLLPG